MSEKTRTTNLDELALDLAGDLDTNAIRNDNFKIIVALPYIRAAMKRYADIKLEEAAKRVSDGERWADLIDIYDAAELVRSFKEEHEASNG